MSEPFHREGVGAAFHNTFGNLVANFKEALFAGHLENASNCLTSILGLPPAEREIARSRLSKELHYDQTVLMKSAELGELELANQLLRLSVDVTVRNSKCEDAFIVACGGGKIEAHQFELVQKLFEHLRDATDGARPTSEDLNAALARAKAKSYSSLALYLRSKGAQDPVQALSATKELPKPPAPVKRRPRWLWQRRDRTAGTKGPLKAPQ